MSFARYPAYKDSGVDWLGEVPAHWEVHRLKRSAQLLTEKTDRRTNPVALENIESWSGRFVPTDTEFAGDGVAFQHGDILFGKLRPYLAKALLAQNEGEAVGDFHVMRPQEGAIPRFLQYQLLEQAFIDIVDGSTFGSKMPRASWEFVGTMPLPAPPPSEQTAIATFLDRETAKIDALVAEQERLIALLKEKRQAVISHAVTKGLDPSVPMMDSGVEWLGKVPAHWLIRPIKHVGRLKGGAGFPHSEQGVEGEELCFYKVGSLGQSSSTGYLNESENTISRETASALGAFIFPKETLVFAKVGAALFLARVRALPADACLDNNMMGLVVDETKHAPAFVRYAMTLVRFDLIANPGAVPSLNEGQIGNFALAFPPSKAEQEAIAAFLDRATGQLEDLFAQAETVISTLRERRTALISAAVTGQIDVRGAPEQAP